MIHLLIIKTGSTSSEIAGKFGDFEDWFTRIVQRPNVVINVCDVAGNDELPDVSQADGVIVTGSPAMVTDKAPWSEATAAWLRARVEQARPVLGVCYGHQLLAHALGGEAGFHPKGREIGTHEVCLTAEARDDALLGGHPSAFPAHLTHMQSITRLPAGAVVLATSRHDPYQAFRFGSCAWGVQFHPEFNADIMGAYLRRLSEKLIEEGYDLEQLMAEVAVTVDAKQVLDSFVDVVTHWIGSDPQGPLVGR